MTSAPPVSSVCRCASSSARAAATSALCAIGVASTLMEAWSGVAAGGTLEVPAVISSCSVGGFDVRPDLACAAPSSAAPWPAPAAPAIMTSTLPAARSMRVPRAAADLAGSGATNTSDGYWGSGTVPR
nr:uncharacterized protein LOC127329279 [Lolium perenne]